MIDPRNLRERPEAAEGLDRHAEHQAFSRLPQGPLEPALHGVWPDHPLHLLPTGLSSGWWTGANELRRDGDRRQARRRPAP